MRKLESSSPGKAKPPSALTLLRGANEGMMPLYITQSYPSHWQTNKAVQVKLRQANLDLNSQFRYYIYWSELRPKRMLLIASLTIVLCHYARLLKRATAVRSVWKNNSKEKFAMEAGRRRYLGFCFFGWATHQRSKCRFSWGVWSKVVKVNFLGIESEW